VVRETSRQPTKDRPRSKGGRKTVDAGCETDALARKGQEPFGVLARTIPARTPEQQERVRILPKLISQENDPVKVEILAAELQHLLGGSRVPLTKSLEAVSAGVNP
jgi:hypothetical protein